MSRPRELRPVRAEQVPALLASDLEGAFVVDPPPGSWAAWKAPVVRALGGDRSPRARRTLSGYPLCALGTDWRALAPITGPAVATHPACHGCGLAPRCSPPLAWNEAELSPFGPADLAERFARYHARLSAALSIPRSAEVDAFVSGHLADLSAMPAGGPWEIEPSILVGERVLPTVRLAVFHGRLPERRAEAIGATHVLLDSFARLHGLLGQPPPTELVGALRAHAPFQLPVGIEAADGRAPELKCYVRVQHLDAPAREALVRQLAAMVGSAALPALLASRESLMSDLHMIGLGTIGGRLAALKLYVLCDTGAGWPEIGLAGVPADHPLDRLSGHRAYAVVDVAHPRSRPAKWDFFLRDRLLSGPMLAAFVRRLFPKEASAQVSALVDHREFRVDVNAIALRGATWAFYCALG